MPSLCVSRTNMPSDYLYNYNYYMYITFPEFLQNVHVSGYSNTGTHGILRELEQAMETFVLTLCLHIISQSTKHLHN